jgi:hypothetical protein
MDPEKGESFLLASLTNIVALQLIHCKLIPQNSCPLCQTPDIAEVVRSFDTDDFTPTSSRAQGRLRRYATMSAVGYGYRLYGFGGRHQLDGL